jgi:hypothetical protein
MDVDLHEPNPAIAAFLMSSRCRAIVSERAQMAQMLYQARVARRSSLLAKAARAHTEIGGVRSDRWIGVLSVHDAIEYEAAHEFGYTSRKGSRAKRRFVPGAHDLNAVLEELGST